MCGPQADADNDKLRWFYRCDADHDDQPPIVDICLGHRGAVHFNEVSFLGLGAFQRSVAPGAAQEVAHRTIDACPERFGVRLKHNPLQPAFNRRLDEDHQSPHVHVFPIRIASNDPTAPDANAAIVRTEITNDVDVHRERIEDVLLALVQDSLQSCRAAYNFVRGRLVDAALVISARVDAHDMSARRDRVVHDRRQVRREWLRNERPRMIDRGVLRIELLALELYVVETVLRRPLCIEHREAVAYELAVFDQCGLKPGAGAPRASHDADLFLVAETLQAGALDRLRVI